ncbi:methyltransferase [Amycolatopsis coloradensis]|uniref:Methyltransferase n=1 Tax=Amycolatopsis coloradensis TaxID=76021 RepID=A0A1R0KLZ6_9PSEU|nr:SAM-dependent methyltransferase [Amycolatopsis coloradensis]OLZ47705.1 methyltransferase [Amycolatopsis coloradensis]
MDPQFLPEGVDLERPNAARIYDWALGGTANWAVDREFGEQLVKAFPLIRSLARANRAFLGRAVRHCVAHGVHQFLDLGSGVPTVGNVHEIADEVDADSRCVYVDNEPVAVAHAKILLEKSGDPGRHAVIGADLRDADDVWERAFDTGVLDPAKPVALLTVAVLHFLPEPELATVIARYRELLPAGSFYVLSHVTTSGVEGELLEQIQNVVKQYEQSSTPASFRDREEIRAFFGDFTLAEPGLVPVGTWRLDDARSPTLSCTIGGVARKPAS